MVREQYLDEATRQNLVMLKLMRDSCSCLMVRTCAYNIESLMLLQRLMVTLEQQCAKAIVLGDGFVKAHSTSAFNSPSTIAAEVRQNLLGAGLNLKLSADIRLLTKKSISAPVGMRATLFDRQVRLSAHAGIAAIELGNYLSGQVVAQAEGNLLSGYSETALDYLRQICYDYGVVATALARQEQVKIACRSDVVRRMAADICQSLDLSEVKYIASYKNGNSDNTDADTDFIARVAAAAAAGVLKANYPPLFYDICLRYAVVGKLFDIMQ